MKILSIIASLSLISCSTTWQGGTSAHVINIEGTPQEILFSSSVSDAHIKNVSNKIVQVIVRRASDRKVLVKDKFSVKIGEFEGKHRIGERGILIYEIVDKINRRVILTKIYQVK